VKTRIVTGTPFDPAYESQLWPLFKRDSAQRESSKKGIEARKKQKAHPDGWGRGTIAGLSAKTDPQRYRKLTKTSKV
jgi:hypothetical protein